MSQKLPAVENEWALAAENAGVSNVSIQNFPQAKSASKISFEQFLVLRVLCHSGAIDYRTASKSFKTNNSQDTKAFRENAKGYLLTNDPWISFIDSIENNELPTKDIGSYSLVRYYQDLVIQGTKVPKVVDYNDASPKFVKSDTPVARRTRGQRAAIQASPTPAPRITHGTRFHPGSSAYGKRPNVGGDRISDEDELSDGEGITLLPTPQSPGVAGFSPITEDEQIVNTALVLFLNCLTAFHPDMRLEWSIKRKQFKCGVFTAITDGLLRDPQGFTRAIIEVKPFVRDTNSRAIQMQEAAQIAAWIYSEPPSAPRDPDQEFVRLLVSQDSDEIYITMATFDYNYVDFLRGVNQGRKAPFSFMQIQLYGPWKIQESAQVNDFARHMLAFTLRQSAYPNVDGIDGSAVQTLTHTGSDSDDSQSRRREEARVGKRRDDSQSRSRFPTQAGPSLSQPALAPFANLPIRGRLGNEGRQQGPPVPPLPGTSAGSSSQRYGTSSNAPPLPPKRQPTDRYPQGSSTAAESTPDKKKSFFGRLGTPNKKDKKGANSILEK